MNQQNNVFFSQNSNYQLNNLMMQYMMMNNYGRNMMQNALMLNNRNLAMGFNQPYTMNNVVGSTTNSNKVNNLKTTKVNDSFKEKNVNYSQKQNNFVENTNYNFNNDSYIEVKKPTRHYTKEELEEINKWILSRKRNFPTKDNINQKELLGKKREEAGMISKLELKLRKKVTILKKLDSRGKSFNNKTGFNQKTSHTKFNNNNNRYPKKQSKINQIKKLQNKKNEEPPEEGEILEEGQIEEEKKIINIKEDTDNQKENEKKNQNKEEDNKGNIEENNKTQKYLTKNRNMKKSKENFPFRYKHNFLYENMIKKDLIKEQNIILQAFRYFINEGLI